MGLITIKGLQIYAYHGVHEVEQIVGQWYEINLILSVDFKKAEDNDDLQGTIDYSIVNEIVLSEMKIKSKLIEHVGGRIKSKIQSIFPSITSGEVSITKLNPPVKGSLYSVAITTKI
jgi:dihydroneopterin aldolase